MDQFDYPARFHRGDKVEVSVHRDFKDSSYGEILNVGGQCCDVIYIHSQGYGVLRFCWHEDDPRMKIAGKFEESQARNTNDIDKTVHMGIFRLARSQQLLNDTPAKLASLEKTIEKLVMQVGKLEDQSISEARLTALVRQIEKLESRLTPTSVLASSSPTDKEQLFQKRRPGRPRKPLPADLEANMQAVGTD